MKRGENFTFVVEFSSPDSSHIFRSYKTATDEELYEVLERSRKENSIADYPPIPGIFRSWANNPGYPILNVELSLDTKSVKVSQELFVPSIGKNESSDFYILYNYATSSSGIDGFDKTSASNWIHREAEMQHKLEGVEDGEKWVVFNVQQTGEKGTKVY